MRRNTLSRRFILQIVFLFCIFILYAGIGKAAVDIRTSNNNISNKASTQFKSQYVPGEMVIRFKPDVRSKIRIQKIDSHIQCGLSSLDALNAKYSAINMRDAMQKVLKKDSVLEGVYIISFDKEVDIFKISLAYKEDTQIMYAEPNYLQYAFFTPDDPYFLYQWHYDNSSSYDSDINLPEAWEYDQTSPKYGGDSSVIVAIVDTGVAYETYESYVQAPDLASTIFASGYDFVNGDSHPNDDNSHGTHVAGTIAQSTNNAFGVAGIAFNTTIMPVKGLGGDGVGTEIEIASAIDYARQNNADIISMSLGSSTSSAIIEDAVLNARDAGIIIVAATGNGYDSTIAYPAAYDGVIAVGATRYDANRAPYSNYGDGIDIVAPGGDTTVDQNSDGFADGVLQLTFAQDDPTTPLIDETDPTDFAYYFFQGTSMATPHVSGVAALLLASGVAASEVDDILFSTVRDLGTTGYDTTYGYGLLDSEAALRYAENAPEIPAIICYSSSVGGTVLTNNYRYAYTQPYCSWSAISGATGYYVYFGTDSTLDPITSGALQTSTTYTAPAISGNQAPYYLKVKSLSADGITSLSGSFLYVIDSQVTAPPTIASQGSSSGITITWGSSYPDNVHGVTYSVYRTTRINGPYSLLQSGIADISRSYLDITPKLGRTYYYYVKATDDLGNTGNSSGTGTRMPGYAEIIVGAASNGSPTVKIFNNQGSLLRQFSAYSKGFKGGVTLATGDLGGDGIEEIITGTGSGGTPQIRIFNAQGSAKYTSGFYAYSKGFKGGVRVAAGDVNGDGIDEIITGAGPGGSPQVRVFSRTGVRQMTNGFYAYSKSFTGGIEVAVGDVDGNGIDEIITGSGSGGTPLVRIFDGYGKRKFTQGFYAYSKSFKGGIYVGVKDVNNDGISEIITGPGKGGSPQIRIFNKTGTVLYKSFLAYGKNFKGGVYIGLNDIESNGNAEILTGPGAGGGPQVKGFNTSGNTALKAFFAASKNFKGGIRIASGDVQ